MPVHRGPCFFRVVCHVSLGVCLCMGVSYVYISFREALSMHSKCGIGHEFYRQETSRRQGCELQKKKNGEKCISFEKSSLPHCESWSELVNSLSILTTETSIQNRRKVL